MRLTWIVSPALVVSQARGETGRPVQAMNRHHDQIPDWRSALSQAVQMHFSPESVQQSCKLVFQRENKSPERLINLSKATERSWDLLTGLLLLPREFSMYTLFLSPG